MIGTILNLPIDERVEGTAATCAYGVMKGCHIVRVHDVKEVARTVKMIDAFLGNLK
ncbi:Dihydropteroate synthase OS=Ureibacillus acetophenoni OX=614649 GN=SAMN05877842_1247 PE=3 SV=1 [Ureibacillus acetophenoni]